MGISNSRPQYAGLTVFILIVAALGLACFYLKDNLKDPGCNLVFGLCLILFSIGFAIFLLYIITAIFGYTNFKKGFLNFLIGDNGTYSLSRLQAVLWAIVIIAYQLGLIFCISFNNQLTFTIYQPIFSESAIWLLGLSLTSSIAVKGITVNAATNNSSLIPNKAVVPHISDILVGDNGLDFSKCQMLIWTLLAIIVFESKCFFFNQAVITQSKVVVNQIFNHFYDEYSTKKDVLGPEVPFIPFLPWSFVVLMGMSQGVYIGKKLVPSFKLGDMKADKQQDLQFQLDQLDKKNQILSGILSTTTPMQGSKIDAQSVDNIEKDIASTKDTIDSLNGDINQINNYLN